MKRTHLLLLCGLFACSGEAEPELALPPVEEPGPAAQALGGQALPPAKELPDYGEASNLGSESPHVGPRLVHESTTPTTEGIRVPPPDLYRRMGPLADKVGVGWANHDGDLAVRVKDRGELGHELELIDIDGNIKALLPLQGYPDEAWWSPRWSRSGRYLALGHMSGDLLDVTIYDVKTRQASEIAQLASGFHWSNATDLGVVSYWPDKHAPYPQPQFHFYRPDLGRSWCPLEPREDQGWVFTGFTALGEVLYREHRRAKEGEFEWDPVGERADRLIPKPPPEPAAEREPAFVGDLSGFAD
jgi:hypothetical protein